MTPKLIDRLHDVAGFVQKEYGRVEASACLATEAADRIAALEAQVKAADGFAAVFPEARARRRTIGLQRRAPRLRLRCGQFWPTGSRPKQP
jgi:hypothetical protein